MLPLLLTLGFLVIGVVLLRDLIRDVREYRRFRAAQRWAAREQLHAEWQLHQLTQDAVQQMLAAVRGR